MEKYLEILKISPLFEGMSEQEILAILGCVQAGVREVPKGGYVFMAGECTADMGLVLSGAILVVQEDLWGRRSIISKCAPGDFFGEPYAAKPGAVLSVSASAAEDSRVLMLNVRRLLSSCTSACVHHQKLIRNLVSVLADKVLILSDKVTHTSRRSTREKLLSYLSSQAQRCGSTSFDIPYDRQQLADFLCVDRAAMSAELGRLTKEGILSTKRKHFELHREVIS